MAVLGALKILCAVFGIGDAYCMEVTLEIWRDLAICFSMSTTSQHHNTIQHHFHAASALSSSELNAGSSGVDLPTLLW